MSNPASTPQRSRTSAVTPYCHLDRLDRQRPVRCWAAVDIDSARVERQTTLVLEHEALLPLAQALLDAAAECRTSVPRPKPGEKFAEHKFWRYVADHTLLISFSRWYWSGPESAIHLEVSVADRPAHVMFKRTLSARRAVRLARELTAAAEHLHAERDRLMATLVSVASVAPALSAEAA